MTEAKKAKKKAQFSVIVKIELLKQRQQRQKQWKVVVH